MQVTAKMQEYWRRNLRLTAILLAIWFVVTYVASAMVDTLNSFSFLGFPFGFYMAAQGSLIIYVILIFYYAKKMNRMDREYNVHEEG